MKQFLTITAVAVVSVCLSICAIALVASYAIAQLDAQVDAALDAKLHKLDLFVANKLNQLDKVKPWRPFRDDLDQGTEQSVQGEPLQLDPPPALFGYKPPPANSDEAKEVIESLDAKPLSEIAPALMIRGPPDPAADDEADAVLLYRFLRKAYSDHNNGAVWQPGRQGIGDCVSWGYAGGVDTLLAISYVNGESSKWEATATESLYGGGRCEAQGKKFAGWSDGSWGSAQVKWLRDWGVIYRQDYPEHNIDLRTYSAQRAKQWGAYGNGGQGDDGSFDELARAHPVKSVALVKTWEEAVAALKNGYPVVVCSQIGFTNRRDSDGFARESGSWAHCMYFNGYRGGTRAGLLCTNSWGTNWIAGPKWPADQPEGSFWVDRHTVEKMLRGGGYPDTYAISNHVGFPPRKLRHDEGWLFQ